MTSTRSSARISLKYKTKPFVELHSSSKTFYNSSSDEESDSESDSPCSTPRKTKLKQTNLESSPPKQSKLESTSRKVQSTANTPSLERLSLISPTKSNSARKSLLKENNNRKRYVAKIESTKKTRKIDTSSSEDSESEDDISKNKTIYQCARQALHGSLPSELPGREIELKQLKDFIEEHLKNKASGSLYVSGPPGTGKTACLNTIIKENVKFKLAHVYINCTAIKSPTAIYSRIIKELNLKPNGKTEKDHLTQIDKYLRKHHKPVLLVLDEIDQLESKNQSILYTIFEWPSKPNSQLLLIGIANALDLTDRVLPRLQTRCELKPRLMHFAPYTKQQIIEIVTSRLRSAGVLEIFSPSAVQMLAGKVASVSGDVRRALDIGRRVIELADQSKNNGALKSVENLANQLIEDEMKTVDLKQVLTILNNVYSTTQSLDENSEDSFPLQQKIIICSLLLMLKNVKNKDITVGKLHEVYRRVCDKRKISSVDQAEFVGLCSLIETRGIIHINRKKEQRLNKVELMWDEEEVRGALRDQQLISEILRDENCLGKL
ncbi:unnamed protein product [Psylliodes chrysocephalus]|uniref:Cell division control protein n=1 Tax=Psylliodes chrysocephalus TaxID=3402493 RepID=A0A9P0CPZ4_9CUCU|nr:unnamed protein product [Psylliodes chrysocephala]